MGNRARKLVGKKGKCEKNSYKAKDTHKNKPKK
jgi:hypothetical protein